MDNQLSIKTQKIERYQDEFTSADSELELLLKYNSEEKS